MYLAHQGIGRLCWGVRGNKNGVLLVLAGVSRHAVWLTATIMASNRRIMSFWSSSASSGDARKNSLQGLTGTISCSTVLSKTINRRIMSVGILLLVISVGYIVRELFDTPPDMYYDIWNDEIYYK